MQQRPLRSKENFQGREFPRSWISSTVAIDCIRLSVSLFGCNRTVVGVHHCWFGLGMAGYVAFDGMSLPDAFVNAAGPLGELRTTAGKILAKTGKED